MKFQRKNEVRSTSLPVTGNFQKLCTDHVGDPPTLSARIKKKKVSKPASHYTNIKYLQQSTIPDVANMFAVPGWSVSADSLKVEKQASANSAPGTKSRKRKRPANAAAPLENVDASNVADLYESVIEGKKGDKPKRDQAAKRQKKDAEKKVKKAGGDESEKTDETEPKPTKDSKEKKEKKDKKKQKKDK